MKTNGRDAGAGGVRGHRVGQVAGGGAGDLPVAQALGGGGGQADHAVLEGVRRVGRVVLDPQPAGEAELLGQPVGAHQRRQAGVEAHPAGRVVADGQQRDVAPDVLRARLDLLAGHRPHQLGVVVDLQRAEALGTGVLGDQPERGAAVAADEAAGGVRGDGATGRRVGLGRSGSGQGHTTTTSSSSPHRAVEPRGTELAPPARRHARAAVAGASSGRVPLPLWMSGTPRTVPSPRRGPAAVRMWR